MKTKTLLSQLMLLLLFSLSFTMLSAQAPPVKQWDKSFGGVFRDVLYSIQQTSDGGYILGGYSDSYISGDKTESNRGGYDYWVVKIDVNGNKQWDKTFGGSEDDQLNSLQQTSDGGYILGGYSYSGISGDKTAANNGWDDYWIVKIDANGNKQWDKTFGGSGFDELNSLQQTKDGGYILGGLSTSGVSGNKNATNKGGYDYWIVKVDSTGKKQWDKAFGGSDMDGLYSLQQTTDGGYILGGSSNSGISGNKATPDRGADDYWIVKVDSSGKKQWDRTFGGSDMDEFFSLQQTTDGGYILGGASNSGISGDKTDSSRGSYDYWIVKVNNNGKKQWDRTFGGSNEDGLYAVSVRQTSDKGYILGGSSYSGISGDKTEANRGFSLPNDPVNDYWIVKTDSSGTKQWDKTIGGEDRDELTSLQQTSDGGYILGGYSFSGIGGDKAANGFGFDDYWVVKLSAPVCENCTKITINDVSAIEGNSGQTQLKFRVHLSTAATQTIKVDYSTKDGTAKAPGDYTATSGTLTFMPGVQNKNITVPVNGDVQCEGDETFKVKLSNPVNATLKDSVGKGTILNDDGSCMVNASAPMKADVIGRAEVIVTPNPASSVVNIRLSGFNGSTAIQLISLQGKVLRTIKTQSESGTSEQFSVAAIASGTYFLTVTDQKGYKQTVKLVIEH